MSHNRGSPESWLGFFRFFRESFRRVALGFLLLSSLLVIFSQTSGIVFFIPLAFFLLYLFFHGMVWILRKKSPAMLNAAAGGDLVWPKAWPFGGKAKFVDNSITIQQVVAGLISGQANVDEVRNLYAQPQHRSALLIAYRLGAASCPDEKVSVYKEIGKIFEAC